MMDVSQPVADLGQLIAGASKDGSTTYSRNEVVFRQGEPAGAAFYVERGKVKVTVLSRGARRPSWRSRSRATSSARAV